MPVVLTYLCWYNTVHKAMGSLSGHMGILIVAESYWLLDGQSMTDNTLVFSGIPLHLSMFNYSLIG